MSKLLLLGMRRFVRVEPRSRRPWTLDDALALPAIDAAGTPVAWERLAPLRPFLAADLLPPGAGWDDEAAAASAAAMLPAIRARFSCCVLLGTRVRQAFAVAAPSPVRGLSLLEISGGFAAMPTPHARNEQSWWAHPPNVAAFAAFTARVRAAV